MGLLAKSIKSLAVKAAKEEAEKAAERVVERAATPRPRAPKKAPTPVITRKVPRQIEHRVGELPKVAALRVNTGNRRAPEPAPLSIFDLEGQPFITSMSDLSAAGDDILKVNDVELGAPVSRLGGQDYMFDRDPAVWAADPGNAKKHTDLAARIKTETGQDPLFLPWAMGPGAVDFSHMPGELMLRYAGENMGKRNQRAVTKDLREVLPDFAALDDPESMRVFLNASGAKRKEVNRLLDKYRDDGGLGLGAARLAATDEDQLGRPLTSLRNVGAIAGGYGPELSSHPSYMMAVPGEGIGRLREDVGALDLLPELRGEGGPFDFPVGVVPGVKSPLRAMQMKPQSGVITYDILRKLADRLGMAKGGHVNAAALAKKYDC